VTRRVVRVDHLPPCTRCGGDLIMRAHMSPAAGSVLLELCPRCSTTPVGRALIEAIRQARLDDRAVRRSKVARLILAWQREVMAEHGYQPVDPPENHTN
jgi:Family of unknown function (DUF6300)